MAEEPVRLDAARVTVLRREQWMTAASTYDTLRTEGESFNACIKRITNKEQVAYLVIYALKHDVAGRIGGSFVWTCPDCGNLSFGQIDKTPKTGWDEPRWTISDPYGQPSLNPTVACATCKAQWLLQFGVLKRVA